MTIPAIHIPWWAFLAIGTFALGFAVCFLWMASAVTRSLFR